MGENTVDRRVRKTKKQLKQGLAVLLSQKPVNTITVREISDLVDINRGTFYLHYRDIFDMMEQIENEMIEELNRALEMKLEKDKPLPLLDVIFGYIAENADISLALFGPNGDSSFGNRIHNLIHDKWLNDWIASNQNVKNFDYYVDFTLSGCLGILRTWLKNGMKETPKEMAALAERAIQNGPGALI